MEHEVHWVGEAELGEKQGIRHVEDVIGRGRLGKITVCQNPLSDRSLKSMAWVDILDGCHVCFPGTGSDFWIGEKSIS